MKKTGFILMAVMAACLGIGCASTGKKAVLAQREPIALVSVVSNDDINWQGEETIKTRNLFTFANKVLSADPDNTDISNADELIITAETLIRNTAEGSVITLADRETVLRSRSYQEARLIRSQVNHKLVTPGDFRFIDYRDKNFAAALAKETGIQRSMYVEFEFTKSMISGIGKNGNCAANVDMTVSVLDARGKTLIKRTYSLRSKARLKVSSGVYSQTGLTELFEDTIVEAVYDFLDYLAK
jgi:hypothetical protein